MGIRDEALPDVARLREEEWVWHEYCTRFGPPEETPDRVRLDQVYYDPGVWALATYVAEWGGWEEEFTVELRPGKEPRAFRYPEDPYLPGLARAASGPESHDLLTRYVGLQPWHVRLDLVRYRPATRAVLRQRARWRRGATEMTFFMRAVPPHRLPAYLKAAELVRRSGFGVPPVAGYWSEGGVVWSPAVPGRTVRSLIREGSPPDPNLIFDGLHSLWKADPEAGDPLDLWRDFRWTRDILCQALPPGEGGQILERVLGALSPFVESWMPSGLAHNDFYDDQILLTPSGRLVVVDFEEVGPGDPLLDVGNFLAHLRWMERFGSASAACGAYREEFQHVALTRFGWPAGDVAVREAYALFRLCSNPVREPGSGWLSEVLGGLALVEEALGA